MEGFARRSELEDHLSRVGVEDLLDSRGNQEGAELVDEELEFGMGQVHGDFGMKIKLEFSEAMVAF